MLRITLIAWFFILAGWSADAAELVLRGDATVASGVVRLADVAQITGADPADAATLEGVLLFPAPSLGKERIVRRGEIVELLALAEIDVKSLFLSGADQIVIRRSTESAAARRTDISPAKMKNGINRSPGTVEQSVQHALVSYLEDRQPGDVAWSVAPAIPSRYLSRLKDAEQISVAGGQAPYTGRQSFEIVARVQGQERRIPIQADVAALPRAVVAARALGKGQVIRSEDIEVQPLATDVGNGERLLSRDEIVGREATKSLVPGQPITGSAVQMPRLVHRGDKVTVTSLAAGVSITTSGKATRDGALGDSVAVELEDPKRQILAKVTGPQSVEIGLAESPSAKMAAAPLKSATAQETRDTP